MRSRRSQIAALRQVALAALREYDLPEGRVTFVDHGENTTFRHSSPARDHLVRVHRPQRHGLNVDTAAAIASRSRGCAASVPTRRSRCPTRSSRGTARCACAPPRPALRGSLRPPVDVGPDPRGVAVALWELRLAPDYAAYLDALLAGYLPDRALDLAHLDDYIELRQVAFALW